MKRQCVVYSFGVDNNLDFDKAMLARKDPAGVPIGCRVMSFDPFCCGAAHVLATNHQFAPVGLATYDGLMEAGTEQGNVSFPVAPARDGTPGPPHLGCTWAGGRARRCLRCARSCPPTRTRSWTRCGSR